MEIYKQNNKKAKLKKLNKLMLKLNLKIIVKKLFQNTVIVYNTKIKLRLSKTCS